MITNWYCNDINSPFKIHLDCLGGGPWLNQSERKYGSSEMMISGLITHKNHFWCHHCQKGLFFPISCIDQADTVAGDVTEVEEVEEEVEEDEEKEEEGIVMV